MEFNKCLPDYRSKERNVLYIIGNGFDLYHGLNTKYLDFYNWAKDKYPNFVYMLEHFYKKIDPKDNVHMLWRDFEKALEYNKDLREIHKFTLDYISDFESLPVEKQKTFASEKVKETLDQIAPLLNEWADAFTEKYKDVRKLLPLGRNSKYITFNYTRVLEDVYGIGGEEHVWHIHGSVDEGRAITGYYNNLSSGAIYGTAIEEASEKRILQELQKMQKPTEEIFVNGPDTFKNLNDINTIIVIGHSLADVDMPYFKYMLDDMPIYVDIEWQYWVHNDEAKTKAKERIRQLCDDANFEEKMAESKWKYYIMDD